MGISTRTPEGQPLECRICGKTSIVLISDPPGDVVCPHCGCFDWIIDANRQLTLDFDIQAAAVTQLVNRIHHGASLRAIAQITAEGLDELLSPESIAIWQVQVLANAPPSVQPLAQIGRDHEADFVRQLWEHGTSFANPFESATGWVTRIGSLYSNESSPSPLCAIEISYHGKIDSDSQETVLRIASSIGAVAASSFRGLLKSDSH
ncbi:MAG: hypothetical protein R3C28_28985 [Pirellulaceae bacterium]